MTTYQVTALYEHPDIERSARVEANSGQEAMVKALIEHRVPAFFSRANNGWLQAEYWQPEMGGRYRWPQIREPDKLFWESDKNKCVLRFDIQALGDNEPCIKTKTI